MILRCSSLFAVLRYCDAFLHNQRSNPLPPRPPIFFNFVSFFERQTRYFMAPEQYSTRKYSFPVDMWAFGVTLTQLFTLKHVYPQDLGARDVAKQVAEGKLRPRTVTLQEVPHSGLLEVIEGCLTFKAQDRMNATQVAERLKAILAEVVANNRGTTLGGKTTSAFAGKARRSSANKTSNMIKARRSSAGSVIKPRRSSTSTRLHMRARPGIASSVVKARRRSSGEKGVEMSSGSVQRSYQTNEGNTGTSTM